MFEGGELEGFAGFDSVSEQTYWSRRSIERLTLIGELFIQSIQRARTERDLAKANELFSLVKIATNDVIWDWHFETGTIERSAALESLIGLPPGEESGNPDWWMERIHPDDREHARERLRSQDDDLIVSEYRVRHEEGYWVHVLDRGVAIRNDEGERVRMVGVMTNVTPQVEATARLEESEARFRAVVENISDVISIVRPDGTIRYASPASSVTLGYDPEELVGRNLFDPVHPDDRFRAQQIFRREVDNEGPRQHETVRFRHGSGRWISLETIAANLLDDESIRGIILVSRDITSRRRMEKQLERSTRLVSLGHLASSVAHEFNNVLMGAQPFVDLIERTEDLEKIRNAAEKIERALAQGKSISQSVLQFSRPMSVAIDTLDLTGWLHSLEDEIHRLLPDDIGIDFELPDRDLPVLADQDALYQSVFNFILRARDALEDQPGGSIRVALRPAVEEDTSTLDLSDGPEAYAAIILTDDGPPLSESEREKLFDPKLTVRSGSGAGLELSVAHELVSVQKGFLSIQSDAGGTTVKIFLRSEKPAARPSRPETAAPGRHDPRKERILLVEDDEIVASGIVALLEIEGQDVDRVETGAEALDSLDNELPGLVILDIGLPDMNGIEIFRKVEKLDPSLPVIFSSGHGDQSAIKQYLDRPNVEFLLKPYDASTLLSLVERLTG
ncbi:MAG: PAS domain S-box protein [Thermoanaerobaculia bacterium]|nr:PAS domain S-box protein [Thermoanaerobaculia bacterium]